jgi:hypothetical protein
VEWFLNKMSALFQNTVTRDSIVGITGHIPGLKKWLQQTCAEFLQNKSDLSHFSQNF